ncbi:MAG TPA: glycoside hydrolase family 13 protein, partial [Candidatus Eremiobacteraeota bacterium]|nr:glycoside hydrolase family 13 protein [Candidatus Eremiobacteraeota bacterium]
MEKLKQSGIIILLLIIFTAIPSMASERDNKIDWDGVFSDQTSLFMNPSEPDITQEITLTLRTYKNDLTACRIRYCDIKEHFVDMTLKEEGSEIYDYWTGKIPSGPERKNYRFELIDGSEHGWYTSIGRMKEPVYDRDFIIIPGFKTPDWMKNAVVYQIFPDRFFDGDPNNNVKEGEYKYLGVSAYTHANWSDLPDNPTKCADFFGGDLQGIRKKLPYLKDLGITVIYLNPIFLSPSNHKYDTQDYRQVDPHFGGNEALKELVKEAHNNGIRIILDGVFNHTGSKHIWFDRNHIYDTEGAYESKHSPWYDFYTFREWPDDYICWWGFNTLPKLNYGSPKLREEIYAGENSIGRMWIKDYGIDGWRLDVPNEAGVGGRTDEHGIWKGFRRAVKDANPEAYITGEIWGNASTWLKGEEFDSVMNYNGHMEPLWIWLGGIDHNGYPSKMNVTQFDEYLTYTRADYYLPCVQAGLNLVDSHDTRRFINVLGGNIEKLKLAIIFQMTYVGAPMIYYGDEIGTEGDKDPDCRRTFNWDETCWNKDLRDLYKKLISIRNNYRALRTGSYETLYINDEKNLYAFTRFDEKNKLIIVLNGSDTEQLIELPL